MELTEGTMAKELKILQIQQAVYPDKRENIERLEENIEKYISGRPSEEVPDIVTVGEMFTCPYKSENFPVYAEEDGGETYKKLSEIADRYGVYLSAGSVPEKDDAEHIFNTAYVFDRTGRLIAKHRKMHMFDINVRGRQVFRESDTLTPGTKMTVFDTEFGKMGLCICFDFRFTDLAAAMADAGAKVIIVPAAFNMTTGPAHWELMFRGRAVDNQVFTVGTSPARNAGDAYVAWGHSMVVSPWGEVLAELDEKSGAAFTKIDLDEVEKVRAQLPIFTARQR